jgi:hypothetical protein
MAYDLPGAHPSNYKELYLFANITQNVSENKQPVSPRSLRSQNVGDYKAVILCKPEYYRKERGYKSGYWKKRARFRECY